MLSLEKERPKIGNRTRVEIFANILSVATDGALKTHIMYKANLSHMQLEKYLAFLEDKGLVVRCLFTGQASCCSGARGFRATEKGLDFLREYSHLSRYLNGIS